MLQTFHEDPKESYQLVENRHPMSPLMDFGSIPLLSELFHSFAPRCE